MLTNIKKIAKCLVMQILKAKPIIETHTQQMISECRTLCSQGITPYLKVFLVGNHGPSLIYTRNKKILAESVGAKCDIIHLEEETSCSQFKEEVKKAAIDPQIHGILLHLPLPFQL